MSLHSAPTPFSSTRATRAGALRAHGLGVIFLRAGRYAACFQGRDAAHELTWDLCGKSHLFQPGWKCVSPIALCPVRFDFFPHRAVVDVCRLQGAAEGEPYANATRIQRG